jgi:hypothetical protein
MITADRPAEHDAAVVLEHRQREGELPVADVVEEHVDALGHQVAGTQ